MKDVFAEDKEGAEVKVLDAKACKWCARGVILKATREHHTLIKDKDDLIRVVGRICDEVNPNLLLFNDEPQRTHNEVIAAFDDAIDRNRQLLSGRA